MYEYYVGKGRSVGVGNLTCHFLCFAKESNQRKATLLHRYYSQVRIAHLLAPLGSSAKPTLKRLWRLSSLCLNLFDGKI